jgi:L-fucose isomerase-like protein
MNIAIYTLTSGLHDEQTVAHVTHEFLDSLHIDYQFKGNDFKDYGSHTLDLIYIRTGGTEGLFKEILPTLQSLSNRPVYLLTSGKSNSLAASMEILSYLRQQPGHLTGEILHGTPAYISHRISTLAMAAEARRQLTGSRLGIIGKPSDWLISSTADATVVRQKLGIELIDIDMGELLSLVSEQPMADGLAGAEHICDALRTIVSRHRLQGFTLRCFDLLSTVHNTGCLALARLNAEGLVAGCEGDVPAMLSMMVGRALCQVSGFQSNPAYIDTQTGQILMAHCTIPLDMVDHYEYDTHFESGIGVAIRGYMKEGPVTIFKLAGDLSRHFAAEGMLIANQAKPDLCRTQQVIQLDDKAQTSYFLRNPIGNHHIVLPGRHKEALEELLFSI